MAGFIAAIILLVPAISGCFEQPEDMNEFFPGYDPAGFRISEAQYLNCRYDQ